MICKSKLAIFVAKFQDSNFFKSLWDINLVKGEILNLFKSSLNHILRVYVEYFCLFLENMSTYDYDIDSDIDNAIVSSGVYIVKYIFKSWNNQQLKLSYERPTFTL